MQEININFEELKELKQRFCVFDIKNFLDTHREKLGEIVVLYGLRRTGKTTIMKQIINDYKDKPEYQNKWYMIEIQKNDTMDDIYQLLVEKRKQGLKLICIDEITKAEDFINNCAILADIFAMEGMQIIVTGTDSLSFYFASKELYDRTFRIRTTYISFAEHNYILGSNDIDDYIEFGGILKKNGKENIIKDYNSSIQYLKESVIDNIVYSIHKDWHSNALKRIPDDELYCIIAKMVELYSGELNIDVIKNKLETSNINVPLNLLYKSKYDKYIKLISKKERKEITKDFIEIIKANIDITSEINKYTVSKLEHYLTSLDLLSITNKIVFDYNENEKKWKIIDLDEDENEYRLFYIVQPAIKYYHLQKGLEFIDNAKYYKKFGYDVIKALKRKLEEKIKGDMLEPIISFEISKNLDINKYSIFKPEFTINEESVGEYDLLIYNNKNHSYYAFEIKHTKNITPKQYKTLINNNIMQCINLEYGERKIAAVLYRGISYINEDNILYFNISDFLIAINKYKDIDLAINHLIKDLEFNKNIIYKNIFYNFESKIKNYEKYTSNIDNEIDFFKFCKNIILENPFEFLYIINDNLPLEPKFLLKDGNKIYYESRLDYYIELVDIAINLQPILLEKVNFNSVIFSSLIKEQHYNFYMNLCEKAVNKLPLTIKNVKFEYFFDKEKNIDNQEKYIKLWEFAINKEPDLIQYLNGNNFENKNIYLNLFFKAYKEDKNKDVILYFDNTQLPQHYQNEKELFQKFNELIAKKDNNYDFFKK